MIAGELIALEVCSQVLNVVRAKKVNVGKVAQEDLDLVVKQCYDMVNEKVSIQSHFSLTLFLLLRLRLSCLDDHVRMLFLRAAAKIVFIGGGLAFCCLLRLRLSWSE